ncbi:MAG: glutathione S-transferase family protein [Alphaproteobacteria bacterium]|nr:glutathione S-transferase family protein [Alphaproteobacteria bacterium]
MIRVYAFKWVPPFAQGLVRDLRVRWALEEAGQPYEEVLIGLGEDQASAQYREIQPFGQVPAYEEDGLRLFESGAIVLRIAARSETLMPHDGAARAKAVQWVFAALNSIEPHVQQIALILGFYKDEEWAKLRRPSALEMAERRLDQLAERLGEKPFLEEGGFTVGDLMMTSVLRIGDTCGLIEGRPTLSAYVARCESRPAFQKALADQLRPFAANAPA